MRSYPVEPERPDEYELDPRRSRGVSVSKPRSIARSSRATGANPGTCETDPVAVESVIVRETSASLEFFRSLLSRTLGVRGGRWDCAHARVCRVTRGATKSPHVSDDKHTGGDAVARGSPGRRAGGFRERGVLAGPHGAVPARTNARGRWGQGWGQGRLRRSRELVLRVQHLPRAGFGPRRDAVRAPLLLALHIQVSIRRGTSGIFSHARPTFLQLCHLAEPTLGARVRPGPDRFLSRFSLEQMVAGLPRGSAVPGVQGWTFRGAGASAPTRPTNPKTFTLNLIFASDQIDRSITA